MDAIGIVAEFNPFHEGHSYLIKKTREKFPDSVIVAVMSGNFVQRGEAAFEDKWSRSLSAVKQGVDLVVQLPTRFSNGSSYFFAHGAMEILTSLNIATVAFGSESGDTDRLRKIADFLAEHFDDLNKYAATRTRQGVSFPKAREEYLERNFKCSDDIEGFKNFAFPPNEILGIDYMIAGTIVGYGGDFFSVKRSGEGHSESASRIRKEYYSKNPEEERRYEDTLYKFILGKLSTSLVEKTERKLFKNSCFVEEELLNRALNRWRYTGNLAELEDELVSKSHTRARVRRFLISYILGNAGLSKEELLSSNVIYPLAFNDKGAAYLKFVKDMGTSSLEFLNKISPRSIELDSDGSDGESSTYSGEIIAMEEVVATDMYNLLRGKDSYMFSEYVKRPGKI